MSNGLRYMPEPNQLKASNDYETARQTFKTSIRMVEIEVFSYCNRKCWFCPNSKHDRISTNHFMQPELYSSLIDQLASITYDGMITYSRYNEPFADRIILDRIREARTKLPNSQIHTNTNGDYLDKTYIEEIYEAGMRSINIQFYLQNEQHYNHDLIKRRAEQTAHRLKLPYRIVRDEPGVWFEYAFDYHDMNLRGYGRNFSTSGTSRGGQVDIKRDYVRAAPCVMPFWSAYIDFNGKMVPCCNFRSDIPEHAGYIVGDLLAEPDLFLNYSNHQATQFRRTLLTSEVKDGLCRDCHFVLEEPTEFENIRMAELLSETSRDRP